MDSNCKCHSQGVENCHSEFCPSFNHFLGQHLNKGEKVFPLDTISSKFYYSTLIDILSKKPTSEKYFARHFGTELKWDKIYSLSHLDTVDTATRFFQFKLLHNIMFLNARLYHIGHASDPLCSLCNLENETLVHFFCECSITVNLWDELKIFLALFLI